MSIDQSCRAHCTSVAQTRRAALCVTRQCHRGRTRTPRRPRVRADAGYSRSISTGCKRKPFGAANSRSDRSDYHGDDARTCQRRRCSRRKSAAVCGTRASRMHGIRNVQLAGSPAVANRPAEAARCLESCASTRTRVYHPNMPDSARTFCAQSKPIPIRDQRQL